MPNRRKYKREWERGKRDEMRKIRQVGRLIYRMIGREKGEEKKRGRKKKLKGSESFILLVLMAVKNYTFRDTASVAPLYIKKEVSHTTVWRYFNDMDEELIERAIGVAMHIMVRRYSDDFIIGVMDSTGISIARENRTYKGHTIVLYFKENCFLLVVKGLITERNVSDIEGGRIMLAEKSVIQEITRILRNIMFCADAAYSARKFRILLYKLNLYPIIKPRKNEKMHIFYKFIPEIYRYRAVAEGLYGEFKIIYNSEIRMRKPENIAKYFLLMLLSHNIKILNRKILS